MINYFRFGKTNVRRIEIIPVSTSTTSPVIGMLFSKACQISSKSAICGGVVTSCRLLYGCRRGYYYLRFRSRWRHYLRKVKIYPLLKLGRHDSIDGWDCFRLRKTNGRHIGIRLPVFCLKLPNVIHIGPPDAEIWRNIEFTRWRPRRLNTTSVSSSLMSLSS